MTKARKGPYGIPADDDVMEDFTIHPDILRGGTPYRKVATRSTTKSRLGKTAPTQDPSST